jgi:hypothetical protein
MSLPDQLTLGVGGEVMLLPEKDDPDANLKWNILDTLERPDSVAVYASGARLEQLAKVDCVSQGLDMAQTMGAQNSVEKAICHQLAATHGLLMQTAAAAQQMLREGVSEYGQRSMRREQALQEAARLTGSMTRLANSFQNGLLAIQKLRTGGRQVVTVQHVQVADGGQAVVAGSIGTGGSAGEAKAK